MTGIKRCHSSLHGGIIDEINCELHPHLPLLLLHGNPGVAHVVAVQPCLAHPLQVLLRHHGPLGAAHCRPRARPPSSTGAPESLLIFRESCYLTFSRRSLSTSVTTLLTNSFSNAGKIENMREMTKHWESWNASRPHLIWESLFCFRPSVVGIRHADSHHTKDLEILTTERQKDLGFQERTARLCLNVWVNVLL